MLRLTATAHAVLVAHAVRSGGEECCGLLLGDGEGGEAIATVALPVANLATRPDREFLLDPTALAGAMARERRGGPRILGVYHSHPRTDAAASSRDAVEAWPEWSYLIVGAEGSTPRLRSYRRDAVAAPLREEPVRIVEAACAA